MSRRQSLKNLASEGEKSDELRRASLQPLHTPQTTAASESSFAASNVPLKSSMEDMRRRIVHLNKELEQERVHSKNLRREKALEIRQVRDEEQKKAATMLTDLRSKLQKEKMNELTSLREQLHKEKEKDVIQIIRQKDEALRSAQQAWAKEKDEIKWKLRTELRSESREDTKREFEKERGRLEQEISDLHRQKRELEDTLKLVQGADKRKIDDIRRIHHEHETELEKFKRNSWQESRQQMAEIRQLLNIIEQLEKKLGLEAGHSMRLRLEKDSLHDMLKKSTTYDAWDRMMSSTMKDEQSRMAPQGTLDTKPGSQELRMLQRKNVELSSLVRKLDEKNQQLATRNAELMAELEKLEKDNRDKNRKLERNNADLTQTNKRLESRNKMLLEEINTLKKARKDNSVKPRGRAAKEHDELDNLRAQLREQTRTIADLKQNLMDKDRRIELLRGRKKKRTRQSSSSMSLSADVQSLEDDDVLSIHSDFSEASEMSSSEDVDSKRIKKLAKELLALERAYALLQAHVGSAVDAERDEMEKQQLQSDLLESQSRIHELERMMDNSGQGTRSEEISQLQADNKDLYHKLVAAEKDRDEAQAELAKFSEDVRELKDQRDLLEFELEEMSQLSTAGSEDWDSRRPRSTCSFEASPTPRKDSGTSDLSLEEIKSCLEELETEKENVLSPLQQKALKQARDMLESMAEKIHHMEITESALRDKVRDLDLGYNSVSLKSEFDESRSLAVSTFDQETLTELQWVELDDMESFYRRRQFETLEHLKRGDLAISTEDTSCMTDLVWQDLVRMESIYKKHMNGSPEENWASDGQGDLEREDKQCMTDLAWQELAEFEESYRNYQEEFSQMNVAGGKRKGKGETDSVDNETMTNLNLEQLEELESSYQRYLAEKTSVESRADTETMTDVIWEELIERTSKEIYLTLSTELNLQMKERKVGTIEAGIMTDLALSELVEMENKFLDNIDYESKVNEQSEEPVEALPEIVLDTFPEDITNKKDDYVMTELKWGDIVNLEDRCYSYERDIEELEKRVSHFDVEKREKSSCTDMSFTDLTWNDLINLQEKCLGYECIIEELENKLAYFEVEKTEQGCSTEISLQNLAYARFNVEMKDGETMTDAPEDTVDIEDLPTIVPETFPGEVQTKDECDMTEGVWDEVVDLKNTYQDYRQNLEEMRQKLALFEVEKDDKESITDIAMQDLADLESMYREHLRDVDSDSNSVQSHAEKESRECMTELTGLEITEMEDFYIENAARVMASSPVVEKWEQESMTDITLDEMTYLEEAEEHYRLKSTSAGEKGDKCIETDLTLSHVEYMEEMSSQAEFLQSVEKLDTGTITELTISALASMEDTQERHQTSQVQGLNTLDKEERGVATELTGDDLKYWEDVEAAHEECLLDREESEAKTGGSREKDDAETMTEFTMIDLEYLEEVDTAHEECLRDREEEEAKTPVEKLSIAVMTDLTTSDLQYLEDVESSAHEECLVDKQELLEVRQSAVESESVEVMTDLTVLDLQYLEDVEAAHEECLAAKEQESQASKIAVERETVEIMTDLTGIELHYLEDRVEELEVRSTEKENAEIMTDMTVTDLQYLEEIEAVHEECVADKQDELEAKRVTVEKENTEVMTDLTVKDLQYWEDVEAAHEECLADKQEESQAEKIAAEKESVEVMTDMTALDLQHLEDKQEELDARGVDKQSAEIMTDMTTSDLQYLEEIEEVHEECLVDKQEELELKEVAVEKANVEVMTDLTVVDLQYWEESQAGEIAVEKESVEVMTDLTVSDLQHLEDVECAHEECLLDKADVGKAKVVYSENRNVGTMTDMTNHDLRSLESAASTKERRPSLWRRRSRSSSVSDQHPSNQTNKNTMTEMTGDILEYYEDVEVLYKETVVKLEEFKRLHSVEKEETDVMTDLTTEDLQHLEEESEKAKLDEEGKKTDDKEVMTDLGHDDLEYLMEVEGLYKESELQHGPKSMNLNLERMEEELDRVKPECSLESESSWVVIEKDKEDKDVMTEMTNSELQYLEEVEVLYRENIDKPMESASKENASIMTELTTAELEYFEEAENLLKKISGDGGNIAAMLAPKDDKEVITDLKSSDIDYLQEIEGVYGGGNTQAPLEVEKDDKGTETELSIADIRDLEDQVDNAAEMKASRPFHEFVRQDFNPETLVDLQSELDYLPILDEPEFILDEEDGEVTKRQDTGVMTELTIADIRDLEDQVESVADVKRTPLVIEDFQVETLESLQSQMEYRPVLDEPEYISDEEIEQVDVQRQDTAVMTEMTLSDLEHLLADENHRGDVVLDSHLDESEKQETACMTELTLPDLEHLEAVEPRHIDEVLTYPDRSETGIQCDLEDLASLMQELSREAEESGEEIPAWFVTALSVRKTGGGFNPIHLVVAQGDDVDAFPTDDRSDIEVPFENEIQMTPLSRSTIDSIHSSEDSPRSLKGMPSDQTDSWFAEDDDAVSKDVGIQCDLLDVLALLAEYQRNANEDDMPLYVSAMNMARDDAGYDPVQVLLRNRSDHNFVQDELFDKQSSSFTVELSRPPPSPKGATSAVGSAPDGEMEDNQSEFPAADSPDPLYTSQDGSDSVFNRTGESLIHANDPEERDVLTDMPQGATAVNRFDRFLKERKDSELLNLQKLKENLDEADNGGTVDVKTLKELEDENELLRRQVQMLENTANTQELENEIAMLKGQVESATDLKEENQLLKEEINILRETAVEENLDEENALLKAKVKMLEEMVIADQDVMAVEKENEELKDKIKTLEETTTNTEEVERENDLLKQEIQMLSAETERIKELQEENEMFQENLQALKESTNVEDLVNENSLLKETIESMVQPERVKELEDENEELKEKLQLLEEPQKVKELEKENEMLREKIQALEESTNVEELVNENSLLKKQIEVMVEPERVNDLEDENEMPRKKVQMLEESSNGEDLVNENALLKEQIEIMEEAGRSKDLEYENETLKEKVQMLQESATVERLANEQLMEQMQSLEDSTARVVKRLEEENAILKENIQILEDSTTNMKDLEVENAQLREKIEGLGGSRKIQELEEENASLKRNIQSLEESSQAVDVATEEFELLKLKVEQLKQSEKKIGELNETNVALRERIDLLQMEKKNVRENWSEMDPTEQLGKADRAVQAELEESPSLQQQQGFSEGVNLLKLLEVTRDGSIPDHIAKELEKLKEDNRELYEELMELRTKIKTRESAQRSNEATQTEHAYLASDVSRGVGSLAPDSIEETITPQVRATVANEIRYLGDKPLESEPSYHPPLVQISGLNFDGTDGRVDYPGVDKTMPSYTDSARDSEERISEPELISERRNLDSIMDDIDSRIQDLRDFDDEKVDRLRTDTSDLVVFDSDDDGDLPPLPESSPPPLPSEPPPDFPDGSPPVLDHGIEVLLRSESSPPRDAATLRASSRLRSHSHNKPPSEQSQPSSRVESPLTVEEPTLMLESEPSELGGMLPGPSQPSPSSSKRPSGIGPTKVPPRVLPKPKRPLLQMRQAGELRKLRISYDNTDREPSLTSQWSRDQEDGVIPPRGIVFNRASSINRGEIDALNEKVEFLERQLKNKENVIRSMKTEASELEAKSLLERKDREMKILDEDVAFLKRENQKKERELLTKIGEMNKKNYEIEQWKAEANNSERQRQRMEAAYMNLQNQMKNLQGAEVKLAELQTKYGGMEKQNFELSEKVKKLERTEREFKKLEHNINLLQAQVQEMDMVEQDRNTLVEKMKIIENQRDDLLRKGRVVESERNDFLRNNKLMEMQKDDLENRCAMLQKTNATLNSRLAELERETKGALTKMHDSQHERNFLQVQLDKMEAEKNEMQKRLAITSQERNSLENQVAELQDLSRDHIKLEDGFHTLRIKLAETTREKDNTEMQIPTLKAKIALLKRACKEKDEVINNLSEEIRDLRHAIAESALDDLSKIRTYGYSPENFVKLSAQKEQERQIAKRDPEDLVDGRLKSKLDKQSQRRSPKRLFAPSPPGTKRAKRFVVLFDYDPHKSPASEHPELELKLKEGDLLTVFGDMDINGYFEAELNGVRGLVPSLYVDEVEDDNDSERELEELLTTSSPVKEASSNKGKEPPLQREAISDGHVTPSSSVGSDPRQCMVALRDYNPFLSGAPGRPPHEQLSFKKGDIITAHEDMDAQGFYRVDLNGQTGFVPGHLVGEVSSSTSFLQPNSSRAPEQILGMLDKVQAREQPKASSTDILSTPVVASKVYQTPAQGNVTSPRHVHLPGSPLPNVGLTRFKPSPEVANLGPSPRAGTVHVSSTQSPQRSIPSVVAEKPVTTSLKPSPSKQIVPVSSYKSRSPKKARPSPPGFFRVLRPVNHDAMLLAWTLPEMDEFGRSNGLPVKGYKIYANSEVKLDVRSPYMAKALVEDLELRFPIKFSIKTVAENGSSSETVSTTFNDTIKGSSMDSFGDSFEDSGDEEQRYRTFVALYDYDPFQSSPNANPAGELGFKEGDILRVFDTSRKDGFYVGKLKNKSGLIPSNFVEEVAVASPRRLSAAKKRQAALPSPTRPISRDGSSSGGIGSPSLDAKQPAPPRRKVMVALYDYNPEIQSPQDNPDSERPFKKGQLLTVIGEMSADGFYHADMNGQLGLVPGSFLDDYTNGENDSGLESGRRVSFDKGRSPRHLGGLNQV